MLLKSDSHSAHESRHDGMSKHSQTALQLNQ